jgi:Ca2+-transporting ATPase
VIFADDNFDTITKAVEEGRVIYDNIVKFILYLLSCNSAEILIVLISVIMGEASPFTTIQILVANIIGT